ncbi:hypothetical protein H4R24_002200 [Coemansia sp. RSA 988]|nr:hypothetical protein H4R24_002200 [Coemansia sp. RSA 988]
MGVSRRRHAFTEKVPTTPRKVIVYTDNLMTSNSARNSTAKDSCKELAHSLADTLNTALVVSTSFRFDPDLNMLEILDPYNPRNNIEVKGFTNYQVSAKLFILSAAVDTSNRPSPLYVKQALACVKKQLGPVKIDELFVSFADISATNNGNRNGSTTSTHKHRSHGKHLHRSMGDRRGHNLLTRETSRIIHESSSDECDEKNMARYVKVWKMINKLRLDGDAVKIGICDLSKQQLEDLCETTGIVPDMVQVRVDEEQFLLDDDDDKQETNGSEVHGQSAVGSDYSGDSSCGPDNNLRNFAQEHGISMRTHSDSPDILSNATFQTLAADFKINERFPTTEVPPEGYMIDLMRPRWVVNYSVALRNRGLIANRGYIVMASSDCVLDPNRVAHSG